MDGDVMKLFRDLPFEVLGELHDVHLFNFSLEAAELKGLVPEPFRAVVYGGRCWVSAVSVKLKRMRPAGINFGLGAGYRHVAYRVLVDCPILGEDGGVTWERGIYFLKSFTDNRLMRWGGNLMTAFHFEDAEICAERVGDYMDFECGMGGDDGFGVRVDYGVGEGDVLCDGVLKDVDEGKELIGPLKRAFSVEGRCVRRIEICREAWPLVGVRCEGFESERFKSAQFEIGFYVDGVIDYRWRKSEEVSVRW